MVGVVCDADGTPHIGDGIVVGVLSVTVHLREEVVHERGHVDRIVGSGAEVAVYGKQQVRTEHALDDVLRGADDVEVFVSLLYLGEHDFVDVEELVDDFDGLSRLLFIPLFELVDEVFVDIVGPVVHLELVLAVGAVGGKSRGCNEAQRRYKESFHYFVCLFDFTDLRFIMVSSASTARNMRVISGRSSGVRPPLRASA